MKGIQLEALAFPRVAGWLAPLQAFQAGDVLGRG